LLLEGRPIGATEADGWLVDYAGPREEAIRMAWTIATGGDHGLTWRPVVADALEGVDSTIPSLSPAASPGVEAGRRAILDCVRAACGTNLANALEVQAKQSGGFMASKACMRGTVGSMYQKTVKV
jgi:hypothetical protein